MEKNSASINDYESYKVRYLSQYSSAVLKYLDSLETKEDWAIRVNVQNLIDTFNKLPAICQKPLNEEDLTLISKLIRLLAYLPFKESMTALTWLGVENEDYGYEIYHVAYNCPSDNSQDYTHSHVLVSRARIMQKISMAQAIAGRKI